jgi:hypothetical protein
MCIDKDHMLQNMQLLQCSLVSTSFRFKLSELCHMLSAPLPVQTAVLLPLLPILLTADICGKRGIMIKPFFDDAAQDDHSTKLYGHVTHTQFKQCLSVKVRSSGNREYMPYYNMTSTDAI